MKVKRVLLLLSACVAFTRPEILKAQHGHPDESVSLVSSLYRQVVARHPIGIPEGEDLKIFAPYLSKSLLQKIDDYRACTSDWNRKNAGSDLKSPVGLFENDIFSGAYEEAKPQTFHIERTHPEDNGHLRIYVSLTSVSPPAPKLVWRVAVLVSRDGGRFFVDDIIYLGDANRQSDERLTEYFSRYCQGARFVGRQ